MSAAPFDTLKYAEALKAAGVPDAQAKGQAEALAEALRQEGQGVATKADIAELRAELKTGLAELKADLIKWNVGAIIAMTAIYAAIVKLL